jgi:hypothetical protein
MFSKKFLIVLPVLLLIVSATLIGCGGGGGGDDNPIQPVNPDNYNVADTFNFEDGSFGSLQSDVSGSLIQRYITADAGGNHYAVHGIEYGANTYRSESRDRITGLPTVGEEWYGIDIWLPNDYTYDSLPEIILQWWAPSDSGEPNRSPPLAIEMSDGKWGIVYRWDANKISTGTGTPAGGGRVTTLLTDYTADRGRWVRWKFYVRWDYNGAGFLHVWKDGTLVLSKTGIRIGYNDDACRYVKFGLYKWPWQDGAAEVSKRTVYHDNYWRGTTKQ